MANLTPEERGQVIVRTSVIGDCHALFDQIVEEVRALYPDYDFNVNLDRDLSD